MAGVSYSTFMRHIRNGKVSKEKDPDGKPCVDVSEIQRVYGHDIAPPQSKTKAVNEHGIEQRQTDDLVRVAVLEAEKAALTRRCDDLEQERDEWKGQAKTFGAQLVDMRSQEAAGWLGRFLGWFGSGKR